MGEDVNGRGWYKCLSREAPRLQQRRGCCWPLVFLGDWGCVKLVREVVNRSGLMAAKGSDACFLVLVEPNAHLRTLGLDY